MRGACSNSLLDLIAAFDMVDCEILLQILNRYFGVTGTAMLWFDSYLANRKQSFQQGAHAVIWPTCNRPSTVPCRKVQKSALPINLTKSASMGNQVE
jgi:hypothetical protein